MFLTIRNKKIHGGALYYVIFVVFVLSATVSLFLLHRYTRFTQIRSEIRYLERIDDLNSGLSLYLGEPEKYQQSSSVSLVLFDDTARRVHISRGHIGLLDLITAKVMYKGKELSKTIRGGMDPFKADSIVLYVPENRQALYASGNTIINGNAVLPRKGMQRASIEGKPLQRSTPINGHVLVSDHTLPALAPWVRQKIDRMLNLDSLYESSGSIQGLFASSIEEPGFETVRWYGSEDDFQISGIKASGQLGFVSKGAIYIKNDAQLEGTTISASKILVEEGFRGKVQLFARDSLVIGPGCRLEFPSVMCISNNNVNPVYMKLGRSSTIHGYVVVSQDYLSTAKPMLLMERGSLVTGQVYHQGIIELLGKIYGSLYCKGFYRKTNRAFYENHLLDNFIDYYRVPKHYVFIDLLKGYNTQMMDVQNLEL